VDPCPLPQAEFPQVSCRISTICSRGSPDATRKDDAEVGAILGKFRSVDDSIPSSPRFNLPTMTGTCLTDGNWVLCTVAEVDANTGGTGS